MSPGSKLLDAALLSIALVACKGASKPSTTRGAKPVVSTPLATGRARAAPRAAGGRCRSNADCAASEYCRYQPGLCGRGKKGGSCRPRAEAASCGHKYAPVCGCDGKVYDNACAARARGVDLDVTGRCRKVIPDFIACGAHYCDAHRSYCEIYLSDVLDPPTDHACRPLPKSCLPHGKVPRKCDCFPPGTPCLSFCGPMPNGGIAGFHLTCQGVKKPREDPTAAARAR